MSIKRVVDSLEGVPEPLQQFYKAKDGKHHLDLEFSADDDPGELRRARDREKLISQQFKNERDQLQQTLTSMGGNKDIATLEQSWRQQKEAAVADVQKQLDAMRTNFTSSLTTATAAAIATEVSTAPSIMQRFVQDRLTVDYSSGNAQVRVLDATGKVSALTLEDLKKELRDNKEFAAIVVGSKASGGGANGGGGSPGGGAGRKALKDMNDAERVAFFREDPVAFSKASAPNLS